MTAFNVGDRVAWPARDGWHRGEVLGRRPCRVLDGNGRSDSLELDLWDEETCRVVTRQIRSVCAMIPGEHIARMTGGAGFIKIDGERFSISGWRLTEHLNQR